MADTSKYKQIEVESLRLDPENPRLPESLRRENDEKSVLDWMLTDATLIDLVASIAENGFFEGEPIIVMPGEVEGSYIVLEGNRRLAAIKLLQNPSLASRYPVSLEELSKKARDKNSIPTVIWAFVCSERREVENYLGFRHISGVKQWPVLSKARYLTHLYQRRLKEGRSADPQLFRELAREIGSKAPYVRRLLYGFRLFSEIEQKKFYRIEGLEEETFDFTLITDAATKYSEIATYLGLDFEKDDPLDGLRQDRLREVAHWLYEKLPGTARTRVGSSHNLTVLSRVLKNEASRNAFVFENKSLEAAALLSGMAEDNFRDLLDKVMDYMQQTFNTVNQIHVPTQKDLDVLENIRTTADDIEDLLRRKIKRAEREARLQMDEK